MAIIDRERLRADGEKAERAAAVYCLACVSWKWPGQSRAIKGELHGKVTAAVEGESSAVRGATELVDWSIPALKHIKALRREVTAWVDGNTADWIEAGARLLPLAGAEMFDYRCQGFSAELMARAHELQWERVGILGRARERRGRAYSEADYPADLSTWFGLTWSYRPLTIPEALRDAAPSVAAGAQARQMTMLASALSLNEAALTEQLSGLVSGLLAQLQPSEAGKPIRVYEATVEALTDFLARFSSVVLWGADEIEEVVSELSEGVQGVRVSELRSNLAKRLEVSVSLIKARDALAELRAGQQE